MLLRLWHLHQKFFSSPGLRLIAMPLHELHKEVVLWVDLRRHVPVAAALARRMMTLLHQILEHLFRACRRWLRLWHSTATEHLLKMRGLWTAPISSVLLEVLRGGDRILLAAILHRLLELELMMLLLLLLIKRGLLLLLLLRAYRLALPLLGNLLMLGMLLRMLLVMVLVVGKRRLVGKQRVLRLLLGLMCKRYLLLYHLRLLLTLSERRRKGSRGGTWAVYSLKLKLLQQSCERLFLCLNLLRALRIWPRFESCTEKGGKSTTIGTRCRRMAGRRGGGGPSFELRWHWWFRLGLGCREKRGEP